MKNIKTKKVVPSTFKSQQPTFLEKVYFNQKYFYLLVGLLISLINPFTVFASITESEDLTYYNWLCSQFVDKISTPFNVSALTSLTNVSVSTINNLSNVSAIMKIIAINILTIFMLVKLFEKYSSESFNIEQMCKTLITFIIATALIENSLPLATSMVDLGNTINASVIQSSANIEVDNEAMNTLRETIKNDTSYTKYEGTGVVDTVKAFAKTFGGMMKPLFNTIYYAVCLGIPTLFIGLCNLLLNMICWSRVVMVLIKALFLPIPIADIYNSGPTGTSMRYVKSFFASCLQGSVIAVILAVVCSLQNDIISGAMISGGALSSTVMPQILLGITAVGTTFKSEQLSKEILGVG